MSGALEIIPPGSLVVLSGSVDIIATVEAVCVGRNDRITYEVDWWANGERKSAAVHSDLVQLRADVPTWRVERTRGGHIDGDQTRA